jgi:MFS transporter, DHA3 family, macrolide efflux protein
MGVFLLVWIGQVVSLFGSKLTEFAMGVWVYEQTGSITQFGLVLLFIYLPNILISPLAGTLVDRWNRRFGMLLSDSVAGIATLSVMLLVFTKHLELWHVYLAVGVISFVGAFQVPAYTAAIAQLVSKKDYSRANGMVQISKALAKLISPLMAGFLLGIVKLEGILLIDFATFIFSTIVLLNIKFPPVEKIKTKKTKLMTQLWNETVASWNYIAIRPGLKKLLGFVAITYFTMGMLEVLFWPFVLDFGSSKELGMVLSIGGCGMLVGSLLISAWGGPRHRIYGILYFVPLQGVFILLGGLKSSVVLAAVGIFGYLFAQPIIVSCNQSIWQSKVPINLHGRVFALQQMLERSLSILAYIITGPLVEHLLEPMMSSNGLLANNIGKIIGVGPGRGTALMLVVIGLINIFATVFANREPRLKYLERELPDAIESSSIPLAKTQVEV